MLAVAILLPLLPLLVRASPLEQRATAEPYVGETTSNVFPPSGTSVNSNEFPGETAVGYPGPTPTGVEPAAIQTAPAFPYNSNPAASFPLVADQPQSASGSMDITKYWGNLSPWYSVQSSAYGLPNASPRIPDTCEVTQVHILYRHGARYPTTGAPPSAFATKLHNATANGQNWTSSGELDFLSQWTYKLGAELLTPFGRLQNFALGVEFRQQYGMLLNNFTQQGALPVFRTQSQDRMVKTAENFAAGFFGVPEYLDQVNIEIVIEASGSNNTGAPYDVCKNANVATKGSVGSAAATKFATNAFNSTLDRLNGQLKGIELTPTDIIAMLQLCSYETDALGYSAFCKVFTEEDFKNYEYYFDILFYYNNGFGSPVAAAQGKGYLEEFVSRFTQTRISSYNSTTNSTLDNSSKYFPLNQSIYADATHEVVVLDTLTALNLTALAGDYPLPIDHRDESHPFKASQTVPFATHLVIQVLECSNTTPSKQMRFIVNDAVLPLDKSYPGCAWSDDGLCSYDTVVSALENRVKEINFERDCFADYNATAGSDYNGRAPA